MPTFSTDAGSCIDEMQPAQEAWAKRRHSVPGVDRFRPLAVTLISDLLDVSRIEAGKLRLECEIVDIAGVIAEAVDDCRPAIDARLQHLDVDSLRQARGEG